MKICLVGGIFHKSVEARSRVQPTTETMLAEGLKLRGHDVICLGPRDLGAGTRASVLGEADVVHVHHPGRLTTLLSLIGGTTPLVYTPHRTNLPPKRILALGHRRMMRRADRIVALSPAEAEEVCHRWGREGEGVATIPNGFDDSPFPRQDRSRPGDGTPWTVLFVGQLLEPKQPEAILEAVDCPELTDVVVRYVSHNPVLQPELEREVEARHLEQRVTFVGQRNGKELAAEYHAAHVLVLPSRSLEALPSVITEATFTGLPVIAGDVGGIRWQLGGSGHCIEDIDASKLRSALTGLFSNYEDEVRAARKAAERSRRLFSEDEMIDRHVDLYAGLTA